MNNPAILGEVGGVSLPVKYLVSNNKMPMIAGRLDRSESGHNSGENSTAAVGNSSRTLHSELARPAGSSSPSSLVLSLVSNQRKGGGEVKLEEDSARTVSHGSSSIIQLERPSGKEEVGEEQAVIFVEENDEEEGDNIVITPKEWQQDGRRPEHNPAEPTVIGAEAAAGEPSAAGGSGSLSRPPLSSRSFFCHICDRQGCGSASGSAWIRINLSF
jgi:hypothetical protein